MLSALTGAGLDKLLPAVRRAHEVWNRRLPTGSLNRWFEEHPVHAARIRHFLTRMEKRKDVLCTSSFAVGETLVGPYKKEKCDVVVATVVAAQGQLAVAERMAIDFLNTDRVLRWAEKELGI